MLRLISKITIEQMTDWQPTAEVTIERNEKYVFNFVNELEIVSKWNAQTDTCKFTFPRNMYFEDEKTGTKVNFTGRNIIFGDTPPIIQRGDKITVELGYTWFDGIKDVNELNKEFEGFVVRVFTDTPVRVECEDKMFLLKQLTPKPKIYLNKDYNIETMIKEMVSATKTKNKKHQSEIDKLKVRVSIKTQIGDFYSENETISQVLARLRKDTHTNSYIRGNELRCSAIVYYPEDQKDIYLGRPRNRVWNFDFNKNIIDNDLEYKLKEDINLHIKAISINKVELNTTTKKGKPKKVEKRLSVIVPDNNYLSGSETITRHFYDIQTVDELRKLATLQLNRIWLTGLKGSFETFGLPSVRHGDIAKMQSLRLKEQNGIYLIKSVTKTFGINGYRQNIELDTKLTSITDVSYNAGII
jgi:hypothetical protein